MRFIPIVLALAAIAAPAVARASEWRVVGAPGEPVFALTTLAVPDKNMSWTFQCETGAIAVMQTGVTELMDIKTGTKVPDAPGSVMTPGAAFMGLMADKADTGLLPATAKANPAGGWDMMIRLPKTDRTLGKLAKAKTVVLMTTGFTALVGIEPDGRKVVADFLDRCGET